MAEPVASPRSSRVREVRRLLRDPAARREAGLWVLEGPNLAEEALRSGLPVRLWVFAEGGGAAGDLRAAASARGQESVVVSGEAFRGLSDTRSPLGVLCVVPAPRGTEEELFRRPGPVVALDGVQDPGNLGTLARSAEAAGAAGLLLGPSCVDAGNPK
ncbi:MAG: RNA methyltransferase, partial [Deltaproteobacteria bacterium]|nr:RNA methyltransferase [Deltaproteobacteria bacterium]